MTNTATVTQKNNSPRGVSKSINSGKEQESKCQGLRRKPHVPNIPANIPAADLNVTQPANRIATPRPLTHPSNLELKAKVRSQRKPARASDVPVAALISVKATKASPARIPKLAAAELNPSLLKELESKLKDECTINGKVDDSLVDACKRLAIDCVTEELILEHSMILSSLRDQFAQKMARSLKSAVTQTLPAGVTSTAFALNFNLDRRDMLQSAGMEVPTAEDSEWEKFVKMKLGAPSRIETSRGLAEVQLRQPERREETIEASRYLAQKLFKKILPGKCREVSKLGRYDHMAMALRNFSAVQIEHYGPVGKKLSAVLIETAKGLMKGKAQSDPTVWTFVLQAAADKFRDDHYR